MGTYASYVNSVTGDWVFSYTTRRDIKPWHLFQYVSYELKTPVSYKECYDYNKSRLNARSRVGSMPRPARHKIREMTLPVTRELERFCLNLNGSVKDGNFIFSEPAIKVVKVGSVLGYIFKGFRSDYVLDPGELFVGEPFRLKREDVSNTVIIGR